MLTCSICLELVKEPQTLMQCFHNYCKPCTQQLLQKQNNSPGIVCPMCNEFSADGEIRNNDFLNDLLGLHSNLECGSTTQVRFCDQCPTDTQALKASQRCLDCREYLCNNCKAIHSRLKVLRGHRLLELTDETEVVVDKLVFCKTHADEILRLYCNECNEVICILCQVIHHKNHDTVTTQQALDTILPVVNQNLHDLGVKLENINKVIEIVVEERDKTKRIYEEVVESFDQQIEERIKQMRTAQKKIKEQIRTEQEIQIKQIEDIKTQLKNLCKQLNHLQKVTGTSVEKARHVTLLQELIQGKLLKRLQTVNSEENVKQLQRKLPTLEMNKLEWGELVKKGLCGEVRFNSTTLKVGHVFAIGFAQNAGVRHWDGDFTQVFCQELKQTLKIELPNFCDKVTVSDEKVFAPIRNNDVIQVYNKQGQLQDTIAAEGPVCVEKSPVGDILVCCIDAGLFVLKEDSKQLVNIDRGEYSDMCMYGDKVYTWDYRNTQIVEFVMEKMEWKKQERVVNVSEEDGGSENDTLLVRQCEGKITEVEFFVCLCHQRKILRVSEEGNKVSEYGNWKEEFRLGHLYMCGVDCGDQILVAGSSNGEYKVVNTNTGEWRTVFTGDNTVYDAKVENEHTIWFSGHSNRKHFIAKHNHI